MWSGGNNMADQHGCTAGGVDHHPQQCASGHAGVWCRASQRGGSTNESYGRKWGHLNTFHVTTGDEGLFCCGRPSLFWQDCWPSETSDFTGFVYVLCFCDSYTHIHLNIFSTRTFSTRQECTCLRAVYVACRPRCDNGVPPKL